MNLNLKKDNSINNIYNKNSKNRRNYGYINDNGMIYFKSNK